MKKKIACSFLVLALAVICCGCVVHAYNNPLDYTYYEYKDSYEPDITYKKDANDHTPTVYITKYGKRYHKMYCSHAKNVYIILTVSQAIDRGYSACYYCCY